MSEESFQKKLMGNVADKLYDDLFKPSVGLAGEALGAFFKAITFYPRLWGQMSDIKFEDAFAKFKEEFDIRSAAIPEENRQLPPPHIAGPVVQALEYAIYEDELRSLFAALLTASMDKTNKVHPDFVEVIKRLDPSEAYFLKNYHASSPRSMENLSHFKPVFKLKAKIELKSDGGISSLETRDALEHILEMFRLYLGNGLTGNLIGRSAYYLTNYARLEMEYIIYPVNFMNQDMEMILDHLQSMGIMEFNDNWWKGPDLMHHLPHDELLSFIKASIGEGDLLDRSFVPLSANPRQRLPMVVSSIGYQTTFDLRIFEPTKFGERFIRMCIPD